MGIWDGLTASSIAAGIGQGLNAGVQNFNEGQQRQQQMATQRAEIAMREQQAKREQQTFDQQKAQQALAFAQQQGQHAWALNDTAGAQQAANAMRGLYGAAYPGAGITAPQIMGAPRQVPDTPSGGLYQGPTPAGAPMATPMKTVTDVNNPQSQQAIAETLGLVPQYTTLKPDETMVQYDPITRERKVVAHAPKEFPPAYRVNGGVMMRGADGQYEFYGTGITRTAGGAYDNDTGQIVPGTAPGGKVRWAIGADGNYHQVTEGMPAQAKGGSKPPANWQAFESVRPYMGFIQEAATAYGVPAGVLAAQVWRESGGNRFAKGDGGDSLGLMQMGSDARKGTGLVGPRDPYDPRNNIMAGARWLRHKIDENGGDLWKGVRAYNGSGPLADRYLAGIQQTAPWFEQMPTEKQGPLASDYGQDGTVSYVEKKPGVVVHARPQTVLDYGTDGTATVVPRTAGTTIRTKPDAPAKPKAWTQGMELDFTNTWRTTHGIMSGMSIPADKMQQYNADLAKAKGAWKASQRGSAAGAMQQLLDLDKAGRQ